MRTMSVVSLTVASLGFGLGLWLGVPWASRSMTAPCEESASDDRDANQSTLAPLAREGAEDAIAPAITNADEALAALCAAVPPPALPKGRHTLRGIILTEYGMPVAGARVSAVPTGLEPDESPAEEGDAPRAGADVPAELAELAGKVRDFIREAKVGDACTSTVTDGDGVFRIEGLRDRDYELRAVHEAYEIKMLERDQTTVNPTGWPEGVFLVALATFDVPVSVVLPDGSAPAQARIHDSGTDVPSSGLSFTATYSGEAAEKEWSPERPGLRLSKGSYRLYATAGEGDRFLSPSRDVIVVPGLPVAPVVLELKVQRDVAVTVNIPPVDPMTVVYVWLLGPAPGVALDPARCIEHGTTESVNPQSGSSAYVTFGNVEPGAYLLGAGRNRNDDAVPEVTTTIQVGDAPVRAVLELPPAPPERTLVCRCLCPEGGLQMTGVEVQWTARGHNGHTVQFRAGPDGAYTFYLPPPPAGAGEVEFRARALQPRIDGKNAFGMATWTDAAVREVAIRIERSVELSVAVEGRDATRAFKARAFWVRLGDGTGLASVFRDQGLYLAGKELHPGSAWLEVLVRGGADGTCWEIDRFPVQLTPGENAVTMPMPRLHSLTVEAPGLPAGTLVTIALEHVAGARARSGEKGVQATNRGSHATVGLDGSGRAFFEFVPKGVVALTVWDPAGPGAMRVAVEDDCHVAYVGAPLNALKVLKTWDADEAGTDLLPGDIIVGGDGARFGSYADLTRIAQILQPRRAMLSVVRDGVLRELPFDLSDLASRVRHAYTIVPVRQWGNDD